MTTMTTMATTTEAPAAGASGQEDGARAVADRVSTAAGYLLSAGGGGGVRQLYDAMAVLARRIADGNAAAAAAALADARRALVISCPIERWRRGSTAAPPLSVEALDHAETWLTRR